MSEENEIEVTVEGLKHQVSLREKLHRLLGNPDFKDLVLESYIQNEAVRITKMLGDPAMRANQRAFDSSIDELKAIGMFDNHLRSIEQLGNYAEDQLQAYEEMQRKQDYEEDGE
jgi:Zn-dependent oligopeptidase